MPGWGTPGWGTPGWGTPGAGGVRAGATAAVTVPAWRSAPAGTRVRIPPRFAANDTMATKVASCATEPIRLYHGASVTAAALARVPSAAEKPNATRLLVVWNAMV